MRAFPSVTDVIITLNPVGIFMIASCIDSYNYVAILSLNIYVHIHANLY